MPFNGLNSSLNFLKKLSENPNFHLKLFIWILNYTKKIKISRKNCFSGPYIFLKYRKFSKFSHFQLLIDRKWKYVRKCLLFLFVLVHVNLSKLKRKKKNSKIEWKIFSSFTFYRADIPRILTPNLLILESISQ